MSGNKAILVCECAGRHLLGNVDEALRLVGSDQPVGVPDLCYAARNKDPVLETIAKAETSEIHACHPRAVRALFEFSGNPLPATAELVDHRRTTTLSVDNTAAASDPVWYPVLDYDRCTNCGQCFDFCLFGVYEKDEKGRVVVANPQNCKNNCPACARICPETAIIFPKVGEEPINGAEVSDEKERKANVRINVDEILGEDVYATLNARKQKRCSLLNKKKVEQALEERRKCSEGQS